MNKSRIRLTESQLHRVIKNSVKKVLNEANLPSDFMDYSNKTHDLGNHSLHYHDLESNTRKYRIFMSVTDENGNEVAKVYNQAPEDSCKYTAYDCYEKLCKQLGVTPADID